MNLFKSQNIAPKIINPPIDEQETKNVLNPVAKDFLFSPTKMEADKIPSEISPNSIRSKKTVSTIPAPMQRKIKQMPSNTNKPSPGEKSSSSFNVFVSEVVALVFV